MQALSSAAAALQSLFLEVACVEPTNSAALTALDTPADSHEADPIPSSSTDGNQPNVPSSSDSKLVQQCNRDQNEHLAWTAASASLRRVLQALQHKGLIGAGVSVQQALAAFQNACYAGCQSEEPE